MEELRVKRDKRFRELCDEAIQKADEIFEGSKNEDIQLGRSKDF